MSYDVQVSGILLLLFLAFLGFWKWVLGRRGVVTSVGWHSLFSHKTKTKKKKKSKKKTGSGHCSDAGSCAGGGGGELDPDPLDDLESQAAIPPRDEFVSLQYAASVTIRQSLRTSTGSRAKRREKAVVFGLSSHPGAGGDFVEDRGGGADAQPSPAFPRAPSLPSSRAPSLTSSPRPSPSSPPNVDEVLQNSVRGFREPWWRTPCSSHAAEEDGARGDKVEGCCFGGTEDDCDMLPAETQVCACCYISTYRTPNEKRVNKKARLRFRT